MALLVSSLRTLIGLISKCSRRFFRLYGSLIKSFILVIIIDLLSAHGLNVL